MKIKIAFLFSTLEGYGLVKIMFYLAKYLNRNPNFDVYVITLSPEPSFSMKDKFTKEKIPVYTLGLSRFKGMFLAQKALVKLLFDLNINILHSNGFRANLIHHQIKKKTPSIKEIMTIHCDPAKDFKHPLGILFEIWRTYTHCNIIRKSKDVYACSKSVSEEMKLQYNISIPYIQNGIDIEILETNETKSNKLINLNDSCLKFIVLSGLKEGKNIESLIKAFNQLSEEFNLYIIGDGPLRAELKKLSQVKHIHFLGYQENIADYLKQGDAIISSSYSEGLPLSVMEGMYCNLIPILSDISPHREIVEESYFIKYLFECDDIDSIIKHCKSLKEEQNLAILKAEAQSIIRKSFSAEKMTEKYIDIYTTQ